MGVTRRTLLGEAAALAAVAAGVGRADAAEASVRRGGLRPGLNAYTFRDPLTANQSDPTAGMDLFGVVDVAAGRSSTPGRTARPTPMPTSRLPHPGRSAGS